MKGVPIEISDLCVSYGSTPILKGIDLSVSSGEFIALLGSSGCGKTTLLRALAGFVDVESGRLDVDARNIVDLPPEKRNMAMMFQSYALWPHMTVAQNVGFALRLRKMNKHDIDAQVEKMLSLVNLEGYAQRNVECLSGGQRQRVALARALAVDPPVLLLDEPLSNLDARIRQSMRHEIKALQRKLGLTTILVTHDREEAMAMADRVVIMDQGRVEQAGTPEEIYHRPATSFVAAFMGAENAYPVQVKYDQQDLLISGQHISDEICLPVSKRHGDDGVNCRLPSTQSAAEAFFRSDAVFFKSEEMQDNPHLTLSGQVKQHSYLGNVYRHSISVGDHNFLVDHPIRIGINEYVDVCIPAAALHVFEKTSNATTDPAGELIAQSH